MGTHRSVEGGESYPRAEDLRQTKGVQVHLNMKLTVQLESRMREMESPTYCPLFLLKKNDIVKEMQDAGISHNELQTNQPSPQRGSPRIWFFNAMVTIDKTLSNKIDIGGLSLRD